MRKDILQQTETKQEKTDTIEKLSAYVLMFAFLGLLAFFFLSTLWTNRNTVSGLIGGSVAIQDAAEQFETSLKEPIGKYQYLYLNAVAHNVMGQQEMNNVVKLNNGQLTVMNNRSNMSWAAGRVINFYRNCIQDTDTNFFYFQIPHKICKYDTQLPVGLSDNINANADEFLSYLYKRNVPTYDLREMLHEQGFDHHEMFYATDNHWTTEAAFWGFQQIAEVLRDAAGYSVPEEYIDIASYDSVTYENIMLGGYGKRVSPAYAGTDTYTVYYPSFDTSYTFDIISRKKTRTGRFAKSLLFWDRVLTVDYYNVSPYSCYIGGNYTLAHIHNDDAPNRVSILYLKDSFSLPIICYLSTLVEDIYFVDMRYFETYYNGVTLPEYQMAALDQNVLKAYRSGLTMAEYIDLNDFDTVIMAYTPDLLLNKKVTVLQ